MKKVERINIKCETCQKDFLVRKKQLPRKRFCSVECQNKNVSKINKKELDTNQIKFFRENSIMSDRELSEHLPISESTISKMRDRYNIPHNKEGQRKGFDNTKQLLGFKRYFDINGHPMKGKRHKPETILKLSLNHPNFKGERHPMYGKKHKPESIEKMVKNHKGMIGRHQSEEMKRKYRLKRVGWVFPNKDSSIEIRIQNFLKDLKIEFFKHYHISEIERAYQCDIFIKPNIIIECDGDYWHGNENNPKFKVLNERQIKQRELDFKRDVELIKKGYKVIRLWESYINKMSKEDFESLMSKVIP